MPKDTSGKNIRNEIAIVESDIFNLLGEKLRNAWNDTPEYYWGKTEDELLHALPKGQTFTSMALLRLRFWDLVESAPQKGIPIDFDMLRKGIVGFDLLRTYLTAHPSFLPWMVIPLKESKGLRRALLITAEQRMSEILAMSAVAADGTTIDVNLAKIQAKLYEVLENRVHGAVAQNLNIKQKNLNVNVTSVDGNELAQGISEMTELEEIERRLEDVRAKRKALRDVTPIQVDQAKLMKGD